MSRCTPLTRAELKRHPLPPVEEADKDAHGRLFIIAGSLQTPGSAVIAATVSRRSRSKTSAGTPVATVHPVLAERAYAE